MPKKAQNATPDPVKLLIVHALMEGATYTAAAEAGGITRSQLWRLRHDDAEFQHLLNTAIAETQQASRDRINLLHDRAVTAINQILTDLDEPGAVRLQAAKYVLERADVIDEADGDWTEEQARDLFGDEIVDLAFERARRAG